ncbi:MAG: VWA domain-containing protein [Planctomycetales bacterium]|nr:VWA domain-containing protein [Planctomycetales bacterium]
MSTVSRLAVIHSGSIEHSTDRRALAYNFLTDIRQRTNADFAPIDLPYENGAAHLGAMLANGQLDSQQVTEVVLLPAIGDFNEETFQKIVRLGVPVSVIADRAPAQANAYQTLRDFRRPRILIVAAERDDCQSLCRALADDEFEIEFTTASDSPALLDRWRQYDLVILGNVAATDMSAQQLDTLSSGISSQGVGLIAIGGRLFQRDRYYGSQLERILPIAALETRPTRRRRFATLLLIDKSTSMNEENRMQLAKQAARQTVEILDESDQIGVLAFGTESQWIARLAQATDKGALLAKLDSLQARGKTNLYPAFARAYLELAAADADMRHITLVTDGVPAPADFGAISQRIRQHGITLTTVTVGEGADRRVMQEIARAANGQHFHANRSEDLPEILVRETQSAAAAADTISFRPFVLQSLPGLDLESLPPLQGCESTSPKPNANVLLVGPDGDPLLAWWRFGQGATVAFTSDAGERWSAPWTKSQGFSAFWRRVARLAMRRHSPSDLSWRVADSAYKTRVILDALQVDRSYLNRGRVSVNANTGRSSALEALDLAQIAPGRYATTLDRRDQRIQLDGFVVESPPQDRRVGQFEPATITNLSIASDHMDTQLWPHRIAHATGGLVNPTIDQLLSRPRTPTRTTTPWRKWFIVAAMFLLVVDVGMRRWPKRAPRLRKASPATKHADAVGT